MPDYSVIGKRRPLIDARQKAVGSACYSADIMLPNLLCGKILHSPYPHARILNIETRKAERLLGVKAVATGKDITDIPYAFVRAKPAPEWLRDRFALAKVKVRFIGDPVAAVAAIDEEIAEEALELIEVEYEDLPAVFDPFEAMKPGAPRIHDHAENNISSDASFHLGNVEKGFKESDIIIEEHFETQYVCHTPIEPHSVVADFSTSGELTIWPSTQVPFFDQISISETLGIPLTKVRVIKPFVGGGFGGKTETEAPFPIAAVLSRKAGRPVRIVHTREEEFVCTSRRHPTYADQKIGVKKDGRIVAVDSKFISDGGAYNSLGPITIYLHGGLQNGPYNLPNFRYNGKRVYTNKPFCGAQRGHGGIQGKFVLESLLDMVGEKIGMDPIEIRIKNGLKKGDVNSASWMIRSSGHVESIKRTQEELRWKDKWGKHDGKGVGIACNFFASGASLAFFVDNAHSHSGAKIEGNADGEFTLFTGATDIGQGSNTTLAMIAAEELGVVLDDMRVVAADTATTPLDFGSFSSRVTMFGGNAVKRAAAEMKRLLFKEAADKLEANPDDLEAKEGRIFIKGSPEKGLSHAEVIALYFANHKESLNSKGHYNPPVGKVMPDGKYGNPEDLGDALAEETPAWSFGAHAAEVEVDKETGMVKVRKIAAAQDCGFAINPMAVEGQIEGSVAMSFGQAVTEEFKTDKGWSVTCSLLDYKLPTSMDMPELKPIIVETNDEEGPFGAKESSEGTNIPTIPCITNAIYDAIGVRIKALPVTPENILKALEKGNKK